MGEAAFYPRGVIAIFALFGILISVAGMKKTKKILQRQEITYDGEEEQLSVPVLKSPVGALIIIALYIALVQLIGFFPATILFIAVFMWYMGSKDWKTYAFTIVGLNMFVYLVFVLQLNVQLPKGILFE